MATRGDEIIRYVFETSGSKELQETARILLATGEASEETEAALRGLADEFAKIGKESAALKAFTGEKARLAEVTAQLDLARKGLDALNTEFSESDKSSTAVARAFAAAERSISQLSTEQNRLQVQFAKTQGTLAKAGLDATNLAAAEQELARRSGEAALKVKDLNEQVSRGGRFSAALKSATDAGARGFRTLRDAVNDFGSSLLRITGVTGAITAALGALSGARIFGGAVRSAREFGAVLSEVHAVSGATAEQLERMKETAESVSATTKFSATEAAQGLSELARATGSAEAAMQALPPTMQLAQAAGYGVAESATLVTTTLTQFNLAVDQAGRVADVLAKAANSTSADVQGLGNSLSYAAPLAKQLNLSFEETTAVIGAMADQGFRGERAGTALRNVFSELLSPTSDFRQRLAALGIETDSFAGIMEGLAASGDRGREAILSLDAQARPAILALVSDGGKAIRSLEGDLHNAAGAAETTARTMGDNFESAWSRLGNSFDQLRRSLIDPLLEPFVAELDGAATRIREFVKSADFSRVKAAVSEFATGAARLMREFVESIDFSAIAANIRSFVGTAREALDSMSEKAGAIGATLQAAGSTISLFWNGLQAAIFTAAGVITGSFTAVSKAALFAAEGIAKLNGSYVGLEPVFASIHEKIGGLEAVTQEFSRRATTNVGETKEAWNGLSEALTRSLASATKATPAIAQLQGGLKVTAEQAEELRAQFGVLPQFIQRIIAPSLQAAGVMVQVADASREMAGAANDSGVAVENSQDRLIRAVRAYSDLANSGTATAAQLQAAGVEIARASMSINGLGKSAEDAAKRAEDLKAAFATLGISSQSDLQAAADAATIAFDKISSEFQAGVRPIEDVRAAFNAYAQAQLDAVANSDTWKQQSVSDMLAVKAAMLGLGDVRLPDFKGQSDGIRGFRREVEATGQAERESISNTEARTAAIEKSSEATERARGTMASFSYQLEGWGQKAIDTFTRVQDSALNFLKEDTGGAGLRLYIAAVNRGVQELNRVVAEQQASAQRFMEENAALTEAQIANLGRTSEGYDALIERTQGAVHQLDMLDAQTLSQVRSSADALAQRIEAVQQRTIAAAESFRDFAASAREQIASMEGDIEGAENLRHQQQIANLREQAEEARALDSAEYREALSAAETLHAKKLEQIRKEAEAQKQSDAAQTVRDQESLARKRELGAASEINTNTRNEQTLNIKLNGEALANFSSLPDSQLASFVQQRLMPEILKQLRRWREQAGGF